jgi:hypothetical protein
MRLNVARHGSGREADAFRDPRARGSAQADSRAAGKDE